jgi:signal transduction histidine kinase
MIQKTGIGKEKRKMTEELVIHQKKMDALATLANGIAHDFNNILSGIVGYSEVALSMAENDKPVTNIIDRMAPVIMEVIELVKASLPPDIELRANIACHDGIIFSSKAMIHKAVMNLCLNSIQAMKDKGGTLAIELKETEVAQASAETDNIAPGRYLMLSVSDTGPGIPEEIMDRIFDPYFTTKGNGEGTGLGLSVVYGVIKNYKGAVKVKSAPGEKTTFEILLPQIDIHNLS